MYSEPSSSTPLNSILEVCPTQWHTAAHWKSVRNPTEGLNLITLTPMCSARKKEFLLLRKDGHFCSSLPNSFRNGIKTECVCVCIYHLSFHYFEEISLSAQRVRRIQNTSKPPINAQGASLQSNSFWNLI